jgi:hypothetical protein
MGSWRAATPASGQMLTRQQPLGERQIAFWTAGALNDLIA